MIGLFPTPYPDEILYSLCARYARIVQYPGKQKTIKELFGREGLSVAVDLPSSLNNLTSNFPVGTNLTTEKIISSHTLLPFYASFLPSKRVSELKKMMASSTGEAIHKIAGITASTVRPPEMLKFCPVCAEEDKNTYGTSYWHRLPQLPGIEVCPQHRVFFEDSPAQVKNAVYRAELFNADNSILKAPARPIDINNKIHQLLLQLAEDAEWLLNRKNLKIGYEFLVNKYNNILFNKGYIQPKGRINLKVLNQRIRDFYPKEFLEIVQNDYDENKAYNWVARIIPHLKSQRVHHPLRHLLLIRALDETPESFFEVGKVNTECRQESVKPNFIKGPYPCFNVVCANYNKPRISTFEIRQPKGTNRYTLFVNCECGFSYFRNGPDKSPEDLYRRDLVTNYGSLWENHLRNLWKDSTISVNEISKRMGFAHNVIKNQAMSLGLDFPRQGPGPKQMNLSPDAQKKLQKNRSKKQQADKIFNDKRKKNRRLWLKAMAENPDATRTDLKIKVVPQIGLWLINHDREWLEENQPKKWKRTESARQVDWLTRDKQLVIRVHEIAVEIKNEAEKPMRVTASEIARRIGNMDWLIHRKYKKNLPESQSALNEVLETRIDYNLRLINWAVEEIKINGGSFAFSVIALTAGVDHALWKLPEIKSAIENGQREIKESRGLW